MRKPKQEKSPLLTTLEGALTEVLFGVSKTVGDVTHLTLSAPTPLKVVLAVSGGADSMVLMDVVSRLLKAPYQTCLLDAVVCYVHHGLMEEADDWSRLVEEEATRRGLAFIEKRVHVRKEGIGVEAAAREARYRALCDVARSRGASCILTGQHLNDRIETFLMQSLRGAGLEGLVAFPLYRPMKASEEGKAGRNRAVPMDSPLYLVRPWWQTSKAALLAYAQAHKIPFVTDPSNVDMSLTRAQVRHRVMPALESVQPSYLSTTGRTLDLLDEALSLMMSVAEDDLRQVQTMPGVLALGQWLQLNPIRQSLVLRLWLKEHDCPMPNKKRLDDFCRQLREGRFDTQASLNVGSRLLRRWGDELRLLEKKPREPRWREDQVIDPVAGSVELKYFDGVLRFRPCVGDEPGVSLTRFSQGQWRVKARRGSEKLKLFATRPSRFLKDWFQEARIPDYRREELPLLWLDDQLLFVAGLGLDVRVCDEPRFEKQRMTVEYLPPDDLFGTEKKASHQDQRRLQKEKGVRTLKPAPMATSRAESLFEEETLESVNPSLFTELDTP